MLQMHIRVAMLTRQELAHIYLHKPSGEMQRISLADANKSEGVTCLLSPRPLSLAYYPSFCVFFQCFPKKRM